MEQITNYYKNQLDKVKPSEKQPMKVRLDSREGFTNWLDLNDESAKELIIWLQNNFPNCMDNQLTTH
jgi:hypothetical protein